LDILDESMGDNFENRFKIQKYVFLAKYFGLDMKYDYNLYIHGPYSSALADDYYELATNLVRNNNNNNRNDIDANKKKPPLPDTFDANAFYGFVAGKNLEWLEAASTLLSLNESFTDRESLLDRITNMKDHIPREKIESILSELEKRRFVNYRSNDNDENNNQS
jgi:uncharacterized protein YwgA